MTTIDEQTQLIQRLSDALEKLRTERDALLKAAKAVSEFYQANEDDSEDATEKFNAIMDDLDVAIAAVVFQ